MATIAFYNHTRNKFASENGVSLADLKVMLRNSSTTFDATDEDTSDLNGAEVSGNGWASGGEAISNAAVTTVNTNEAMLDGDDISEEATEGNIGPASSAVIVDANTSPATLLFFIDFEGTQEAGEGTDFKITWHSNGIARWVAP